MPKVTLEEYAIDTDVAKTDLKVLMKSSSIRYHLRYEAKSFLTFRQEAFSVESKSQQSHALSA
jgi:hypothetical protein